MVLSLYFCFLLVGFLITSPLKRKRKTTASDSLPDEGTSTTTTPGLLDRADVVCIVITASHKTVALGIPLLNIIFANREDTGVLATPLLFYYILTLSTQALVSSRVRRWVMRDPAPKPGTLAAMFVVSSFPHSQQK